MPGKSKDKLMVFLSHAKEDKAKVRELCEKLKGDDFDPWLDEERLLPGQDWDLEIEEALQASDAILLCFSTSSVQKEGYIQREYERGRRYQEEKPKGTIFAIPVRLDDCEIPLAFRKLQYVDYPDGYDLLVTALNKRKSERDLNDSEPERMLSPFISGDPVSPDDFIDRKRELDRVVVGRILSRGQSSAIIGEPRSGKTSLLYYLMAPEMRKALYGKDGETLLFRYVDSQTLEEHFTPPRFWEYVIEPIKDVIDKKDLPLSTAYQTCLAEKCGNFVLERLFGQLFLSGRRLVLLLDELDVLLDCDAFHRSEFCGGLRGLASRSKGLVLVLASRQSLNDLNQNTQEFNRSGSPYFNFLEEITLRPFSKKWIDELLDLAGDQFTKEDRKLIVDWAGGHPYFLQTACAKLWDAYKDDDLIDFPEKRWGIVGESFYAGVRITLSDIWRFWSPKMKKAFTVVAIDEMPRLLGVKNLKTSHLIKELPAYMPELRELKRRGFIKDDANCKSGWCVTADVMLWFLADELVKALLDGDDLGGWLHEHGLGGLLKGRERNQVTNAAKGLGKLLKGGVETFIKAAVEGYVSGMSGN